MAIKYEIVNKETQLVEDELVLDQYGNILKITDGWNCEGGGGSEEVNRNNYIVKFYFEEE